MLSRWICKDYIVPYDKVKVGSTEWICLVTNMFYLPTVKGWSSCAIKRYFWSRRHVDMMTFGSMSLKATETGYWIRVSNFIFTREKLCKVFRALRGISSKRSTFKTLSTNRYLPFSRFALDKSGTVDAQNVLPINSQWIMRMFVRFHFALNPKIFNHFTSSDEKEHQSTPSSRLVVHAGWSIMWPRASFRRTALGHAEISDQNGVSDVIQIDVTQPTEAYNG